MRYANDLVTVIATDVHQILFTNPKKLFVEPGNNLYINCHVGQYRKYKPSDCNTSPPFGQACITVLGLIFSGIALPSS